MGSELEHDIPKSGVVCPRAVGPRRNLQCWSQIPSDLMKLVFERLGFADFQRTKSVCSSWESDSRQSKPNNQIPWLIFFPHEKNYCLLLNPEEKEKLYKTQDLGNDFAKSSCVATYSSWLLMKHRENNNLYILDVLTSERITLPTPESNWTNCLVFWIDEKTKDHQVIIGQYGKGNAASFKKGDDSWRQIPEISGIEQCFKLVFKDHKLYCLNYNKLKIFDFNGDIPVLVFEVSVSGCIERPPRGLLIDDDDQIPWQDQVCHRKINLVVTLSGDILIVKSVRPSMSKVWKFVIYKMELSRKNKWQEIVSLRDEAILLELGITVLAKDMKGIKSNSIYFNGNVYYEFDENENFIYSLDTKSVEKLPQFVSSSIPFSNGRWFLPTFKRQ